MADQTLVIRGYKEFLRACDRAGKEAKREVRGTFRKVGDIVRDDARNRLSPISRKSAAGYRVYVRQRGVAVEQSLRKVTGKRPDWGAYQMRKDLIPALEENQLRVEAEFERAIDHVADYFERGA